MRPTHFATLTLATVLVFSGCSSSDVAAVVPTETPATGPLASTLPVVTAFELQEDVVSADDATIAPFDENLDFFSPPKMLIPVDDDLTPKDTQGKQPPVRLVGFLGRSGEKALLAVDDEVHLVTAGKHLNGVEIVRIQAPQVDVKWGESDYTLDFNRPAPREASDHKQQRSPTFSPGLARSRPRPNRQRSDRSRLPSTPAPRRQVTLPALPDLPQSDPPRATALPEFPTLAPAHSGPTL